MYDVIRRENGSWICNCLDFHYRNVRCKHIIACQIREQLKEKVRENVVIQPIEIDSCIFCHGKNLKKYGLRHNKYGDIQRFLCEDCEKTFSVNLGFERMKHNPQAVTTAMQLYFSGESLRNTARSLRLLGVQVSHKTVYLWIKKYTGLMEKYLDKITPQVSDTWRADELFLKVKGNMKYLYALMDDTPILTGMQIYHNYVRPHMALDGKTPAEVAGIKVEGENKWMTLIQNAASKRPS
jgi:transposase-like protein